MSLTWEQSISLILIQFLRDPELVKFFLGILKRPRAEFLCEESREFHCSLRMTMEDRQKKLKGLSEKGDFHLMNPGVPITFPLPFDCVKWRNSHILLKRIKLFISGFMIVENVENVTFVAEESVIDKVTTINELINETDLCSDYGNSIKQINEAVDEYRESINNNPKEWEMGSLYPKLLRTMGPNDKQMCVIVG